VEEGLASCAMCVRPVPVRRAQLPSTAMLTSRAIGSAVYEDAYLLGTSLASPVIARAMMKVAKRYNCEFLSHG
jgi:argininosuccinate synthase